MSAATLPFAVTIYCVSIPSPLWDGPVTIGRSVRAFPSCGHHGGITVSFPLIFLCISFFFCSNRLHPYGALHINFFLLSSNSTTGLLRFTVDTIAVLRNCPTWAKETTKETGALFVQILSAKVQNSFPWQRSHKYTLKYTVEPLTKNSIIFIRAIWRASIVGTGNVTKTV